MRLLKINKKTGKYNLSSRGKTKIKYIVLHYTGSGTSKAGSARANCVYFGGGNRNASADFFVDDGGIWQYNPNIKAKYSWHCGDGEGRNGITNANSIGVEVCRNGDKAYTKKEIAFLKQLIPYLMKTYSVPKANVVRHHDASGKLCPQYYARRNSKWTALKNIICGGSAAKAVAKKSSSTLTARYRVYAGGTWMPEMKNLTDTSKSGDNYAGQYGVNIGYVACNASKYRVKTRNGWLPYVSEYKYTDTNSGCAGNGNAIYGLEIADSRLKFQVHFKGGAWSEWKSKDAIYSSKPIDAIRIKGK